MVSVTISSVFFRGHLKTSQVSCVYYLPLFSDYFICWKILGRDLRITAWSDGNGLKQDLDVWVPTCAVWSSKIPWPPWACLSVQPNTWTKAFGGPLCLSCSVSVATEPDFTHRPRGLPRPYSKDIVQNQDLLTPRLSSKSDQPSCQLWKGGRGWWAMGMTFICWRVPDCWTPSGQACGMRCRSQLGPRVSHGPGATPVTGHCPANVCTSHRKA